MKCPRCGCAIPSESITCTECGKPLETFPLNSPAKKEGFNPMWLVYGGCGCLFILFTILILLIIFGILVIPS